jgi:hypothetical protein
MCSSASIDAPLMSRRTFYEVYYVDEYGVHVIPKTTYSIGEAYDYALALSVPGEVMVREMTEHTLKRFVVHRIERNGIKKLYMCATSLEEALHVIRQDATGHVTGHEVLDRVKQTRLVIKR